MDKRNRNYILMAAIISTEFLAVRVMKDLDIVIQTAFVKIIGVLAFYLPIVGLLLYLSKDTRLKKHWRIILRIIVAHIIVTFIVGVIMACLPG